MTMIDELCTLLRFLKCGDLQITPFIVTAKGRAEPIYDVTVNATYRTIRLQAVQDGVFRDTLYLDYTDRAITCKRVFENVSGSVLKLYELGVEIAGITYGADPHDDYFYHNENPRIYEVFTFPIDYDRTAEDATDSTFDFQAGNRWADPGVITERIGASPYQPFPAILISNYQTNLGLVHGTLSQDVFYHNYLAKHIGDTVTLTAFSSFKATAYREVESGISLTDEWYMGRTDNADDIEKIFTDYTKALRRKLPASYGSSDINRTTLVWGSWNDGIFRNISEELILTEAKYLRDNFPTVKWIQIDDGYATMNNKGAHGLGVPYEGEEGVDHAKLPNGLRGLSDKIRELGLRPAIWIGGFCPTASKIYQEHPEWFMDYTYRVTWTAPLDVSQPVVRDYIQYAMRTLCRDYGFDAVKHDFWSYAFEDSHDLYQNHDHSGYENRRWWLTTIRNNLPRDGYLQTGCDIVMGNPFLGEFFTNYRYGIDIGGGNWDYVRTSFQWGAACYATHTGDLFPPNSDSIGLFPGLSRTEAMFCINYCLVSHSMVEIAGKLSLETDTEQLRILRKAACNPNNGQDVYFAQFNYRDHTQRSPEILYFKTPHFTRIEGNTVLPLRTVGIFNLSDEAKTFTLRFDELDLEAGCYTLTDVWSGEQTNIADFFSVTLEPHASRLLAVSKPNGIQLFDANIRLNSVVMRDDHLILDADYALTDVELTLNCTVRAIRQNGVDLPFKADNQTLSFDLPSAGEFELLL
ncbi:MAG: alpha-galactosidase [Clostridia bacterium]|nr:alpha-galactosidase [Clostridia bacterium]